MANSRDQEFISKARKLNRQAWDAICGILSLRKEWELKAYATTLEDGEGINSGYTRDMVAAVLEQAAERLEAALGEDMAALI